MNDYILADDEQHANDMQQVMLRMSAAATGRTYDPVAEHITTGGRRPSITTALTETVLDDGGRYLIPCCGHLSVDMWALLGSTATAPSGRVIAFPDACVQYTHPTPI